MVVKADLQSLFEGIEEGDTIHVNDQEHTFVGYYEIGQSRILTVKDLNMGARKWLRLEKDEITIQTRNGIGNTVNGIIDAFQLPSEIQDRLRDNPWFKDGERMKMAQELYIKRKRYLRKLSRLSEESELEHHAFLDGVSPSRYRYLLPYDQNILYHLVEHLDFHSMKKTETLLTLLYKIEKATLSPIIETEVGHRPKALAFTVGRDHKGKIIDPVAISRLESMLNEGRIYLKKNAGASGEEVMRLYKDGQQRIQADLPGYKDSADNLESFLNTLLDGIYLAESEIPIATLPGERTWEIRFFPPFGLNHSFAKLAKHDSYVNNTSQGGEEKGFHHVLEQVLRNRFPHIKDGEMKKQVDAFLEEAEKIAGKIKALVDEYEIALASIMIQPEDLRNPQKYEDILKLFKGTFLSVDITGIWKGDTLHPMIIEAQQNAGLLDNADNEMFKTTNLEMDRSIRILKQELKPDIISN